MDSEIRILILEDNSADAELAEYTLKSSGVKFISKLVETESQYRDAIADFSPDIILSDYDLPTFNGSDALNIKNELCPEIPFILYTGAVGEERAIEVLTGGATDYVMKNRLSRLVPAVERALKEAEEHIKRKAAEAERDLLIKELELRVQERTAELEKEVAERKRAEEELAGSRQRWIATLSSIGDAVIATDLEGRITFMNAIAETATGWSAAEVLSEPVTRVFDIVNEHTRQKVESPVEKVLREGMVVGLANHTVLIRKDGTEIPIDDSGAPIQDQNGKTTGVVLVFRDVTEKKKAEDANRLHADLLHLSFDAIIVWQLDDATESWNRGAEQLYGYTSDEAIGKITHDLLKTAFPVPWPEIEAILKDRGNWEGELRHRSRDGREVIVSARLQIIKGSDGILRVLETSRDITESKRAEDALKLTQASIDGAAEMVAWFRPDGSVFYVNDATCRTLGYSREELLKMNALDFSPGFTKEQYDEHWREIRARKSFTLQPVHRRKDGSTYIAEVLVNHVVYGGHEFIFAYGRDITDRKRMEETLIDSRNELQSILDGASSIIYVFDLEEKFLIANKALGELLGSTPEQMIGKRRHEFMPRETADWHEANDRKVIEQGSVLEFEEYGPLRQDGRLITWLTTKFPLRDSQGGIYAVAGISADITERKEASDKLEDNVRERTSQLSEINNSLLAEIEERKRTEKRLRSAQKNLRAMAAEIVMADERSRQHFAADLHDTVIQTLGAAKMRSQLIQDEIPKKLSKDFRELQDFISQSITQARFIMAEMSPPVLNELGFIPAMEWLTEQVESQHGLNIEFQSANGLKPLQHEIQVLLFHATRELLMNVVKHAHADKVLVKVSIIKQNVRIEVIDDGKGFDKRQAFRTDVSSGGFGLFSIRERIRHFGGNLLIQSEAGKGTRAVVTAPHTRGGGR